MNSIKKVRVFFIACILIIFLVFLSLPVSAQTQEKTDGYKLKEIVVSAGEDAISSGLTGIVRFQNGKNRLIEVALQQEQAWVLFGPKFKMGRIDGFVAGSVGHFQGAPWAGPFLTLSVPVTKIGGHGQEVTLSIMQWPCFFLGWEPRDWRNDGKPPNTESVFLGYLSSFQLGIGPVGLVYSKLSFLDDPWNTLPGINYTYHIRKDFSVAGSATWNNNANKWMFYVGVTWKKLQ